MSEGQSGKITGQTKACSDERSQDEQPLKVDGDLVDTSAFNEEQLREHIEALRELIAYFRRENEELNQLKTDYIAILENTKDFVFVKDRHHKITSASRSLAQSSGYEDSGDLVGKTDFDVFSPEVASRYYESEEPVIQKGEAVINLEESHFDPAGNKIFLSTSKHPIFNEQNEVIGLIGISKDISHIKEYEEMIEKLAKHDHLTGVANRFLFNELSDLALASAKRLNHNLSLMFIDLDGFKQVNDAYGHKVGDLLLIEVANRIKSEVRHSDIVARLGGDEFVVLCTSVEHNYSVTEAADRIVKAVRAVSIIEGHAIKIGCSIGISRYPDNAKNLEELLVQADKAMYRVKHSGKNGFELFS